MIFTNNDCGFEEVMKIKCLFAGLLMSFWFIGVRAANDVVCLHFNRTGTNAQSVTVDGRGRECHRWRYCVVDIIAQSETDIKCRDCIDCVP